MGKWKGALNVAISNSRSNKRRAFVFGLKILKPVAIVAIVIATLLYIAGELTGHHYLQSVLYTVSLYTLPWRTLVQIAPLIDELFPYMFRLFGLGALVAFVRIVGGIGIGVSWLRSQF